ncbi:MAG: SOS response-associated peptidase [Polyangiales bacterium]
MCGRFSLSIPDFHELVDALGVAYDEEMAARYRPRWNVPPSDQHWIVTADDKKRVILPARWGYGEKKVPLARSESVAKGAFKSAFAARRCVVPVDGFYEWTGEKGARVPHWFHPAQETSKGHAAPMLLAGLFHEGEEGFDFAILTTAANAVVRPIHDRMPVVIDKGALDTWLRGESSDAVGLMSPAKDELLIDTEVSKYVNAAKNDDANCFVPATEAKQAKLF